jgi:hypothetical protein
MKSPLIAACVLGLAGLVSACGPQGPDDSETIMWSSLTVDSAGKTIVKRDVISRAELGMRRQVREMMRTGALKPEGAAAYVQAAGERLASTGIGYRPEPRYDWTVSHWMWHLDMTEVLELMPSTSEGSGDLGWWQYSDGSSVRTNSRGYEAGVHSGSFCSSNAGIFGCSGSTWQFPAWNYGIPAFFEIRDHRYLQLNK